MTNTMRTTIRPRVRASRRVAAADARTGLKMRNGRVSWKATAWAARRVRGLAASRRNISTTTGDCRPALPYSLAHQYISAAS